MQSGPLRHAHRLKAAQRNMCCMQVRLQQVSFQPDIWSVEPFIDVEHLQVQAELLFEHLMSS